MNQIYHENWTFLFCMSTMQTQRHIVVTQDKKLRYILFLHKTGMCTNCVREPNDNIFFGIDLRKYQCDTWYLYAFDSVLAHSSGDNELKYCLYMTEKQVLCYCWIFILKTWVFTGKWIVILKKKFITVNIMYH